MTVTAVTTVTGVTPVTTLTRYEPVTPHGGVAILYFFFFEREKIYRG